MNTSSRKFFFAALAALFLLNLASVSQARAQGESADPAVLKRLEEFSNQLRELQSLVQSQNAVIQSQASEIQALKQSRELGAPVSVPAPGEKPLEIPAWLDGMKQGGDFRLRYEAFDNHGGTDQDRNRFRVRIRYGIEKKLGEDFTIGFRLTTGGTTDPTSTNQTLGGNFVYKAVVFDKLFAKYVPSQLKSFGPIARVELGGGKTANPFLRGTPQSSMVWDGDVTPEGAYEVIEFKPVEYSGLKLSPFAIGGQFPVVENAGAGLTDAEIYGFMGGFHLDLKAAELEKPLTWTSAVAYYNFRDFSRNGNFGAFARGNTSNGTALLAGDFDVLNIYNQVKIPTPWISVIPFFDYATNLADRQELKPMSLDDAWGIGVKVGEAKKKGQWEAGYGYYSIEPNAVVGAFNDSDFGGPGFNGHADRRGSVIKLDYKLTDYLTANAAGFFVNTVTNAPDEETRRFQADLSWKI